MFDSATYEPANVVPLHIADTRLDRLSPDARFLIATLRVWFAPGRPYSQRRALIEDGFTAVGASGAAAPALRLAGALAFTLGRPFIAGGVADPRLTADEAWLSGALCAACGSRSTELYCGFCRRFGGRGLDETVNDLIELRARFNRAGFPTRTH